MPIKYIGRTTSYKGKTLWEIVGNLKNFGVGRLIVRSQFQRYEQVSYMKILKVGTLPVLTNIPGERRKVMALVERVFRGRAEPQIVQIHEASYKDDYTLIPKDEEDQLRRSVLTSESVKRVLPRTVEFPPLFKEILMREAKTTNAHPDQVPKLQLRYNRTRRQMKDFRVAEEGEEPTVKISLDLGMPVSPELYANVDTYQWKKPISPEAEQK